ncbi:MAG: hypothetical protein CMH49_03110 [Myxococcales bacterium]|nr:hypothetical protein [Myxococcales bacterium]
MPCTIFFTLLITLTLANGCGQAERVDTAKSLALSSEISSTCEAAVMHVSACTGSKMDIFSGECNESDAQTLADTPCEVITAAYEVELDLKSDTGDKRPFACLFFGLACPVDQSCYEPLSGSALERVIELSSTETLGDEYDVRERIEQIASIFRESKDPRGIFSIVYRLITNNAVASVEEGLYENAEWTQDLIVAFAYRYLVNLHGHLTGGEVSPQWSKYYKIAQNCEVGYGRTLGVAIATHLMVDLPYALDDVNSVDRHEEDFVLFGEVSLRIFPQLIIDMQAVYQTDVSNLLQGFFLGEWIDSVYTKGTATTFIYQTVRINAWRNSQNLLKFPRSVVHADIATVWGLAEVFLATLDAAGVL